MRTRPKVPGGGDPTRAIPIRPQTRHARYAAPGTTRPSLDNAPAPDQTRRMITTVLSVAAGGAIGASLRYLTGVGITRVMGQGGFPLGVITVNIVGSFLMGVFVVLAAQRGLTHYAPFAMTGILGGFTTFSAFSLEAVTLFERGAVTQAVAYVLLSVVLSIGGLVLGLMLTRGLTA